MSALNLEIGSIENCVMSDEEGAEMTKVQVCNMSQSPQMTSLPPLVKCVKEE